MLAIWHDLLSRLGLPPQPDEPTVTPGQDPELRAMRLRAAHLRERAELLLEASADQRVPQSTRPADRRALLMPERS